MGRGVFINKASIEEYLFKYESTVLTKADNMRDDILPKLTEDEFCIYENTGNRLTYERLYFKRREFLAVYGIASLILKRKKDIDKLEEVISDICNELCWALPAHVGRKDNSLWNITIDLFAAETAQALSMIIYYLNEELRSDIIKMVTDEINRRVLNPYLDDFISVHSWEHLTNNWCAVCSGCIGSIALYLLKDDSKRLEQIIKRVSNSLTYYVKGFEDDGVCTEGIGYYSYGMVYYVQFAVQMMEHSHGKIDILEGEKIKKIALFWQTCYFNGGQTVSFSDGSSTERYRIGLALKLLEHHIDTDIKEALDNSLVNISSQKSTTADISEKIYTANCQEMPGYVIPDISRAADFDYDTCYRFAALWQDYTWTYECLEKLNKDKYINNVDIKYKNIIFPISQWVINENKDYIGYAAKGGHNGESHNHNDIGSFLYVNGNDMLLVDLGAGEYTKDYFSSKRYDILNCRSLGHNVPLIMGLEQISGNEYRCSDFSVDDKGKISIEFGLAYEKGLVNKAIRELDFNYIDGSLSITDLFVFDKRKITIIENLITRFLPKICDDYIYIYGNTKGCRIHVNDECEIKIIEADYTNHEGIKEKAWLIQWDVDFYNNTGKEESSKISFYIEPLNID